MKYPIPQDWDQVSWCRWSICWPASEGWEGFLRGLITLPMRGWTWDERTGTVTDAQNVGREIFTQNLPLTGVLMACNDDLLPDAFNNIALAINNLASRQSSGECCGTIPAVINNTIQGFVPSLSDGSPLPIWGSVPPLVIPEGGYPEGYASLDEYKLEKCRLAHQAVDGAIGSLRGLGAITVFNLLTIGGLVVASVLSTVFFPPAAIPALLGMMLLLAAGLGILVTLADEMQERRAELVCALYTSNTIEGMVVAVEAIMATIVVALPVATAFQLLCKGIGMMFFSSDSLNGLMAFSAALGYPDANCDACDCDPEWFFVEDYLPDWPAAGIGDLAEDGLERTLTAVLMPNDYYYLIVSQHDGGCGSRVRCISIGGNNVGGGGSPIEAEFDDVVTAFAGPISTIPYTAQIIIGDEDI